MYIVVGLGNPGDEYKNTRHNAGRLAAEVLAKKDIDGVKVIRIESFMNLSGVAVAKVVKSTKAARKLIVIYDDLDLPIGTFRISYDRGSGGHKGIESIIKALKTREFIRIRLGISPSTPGGKLKKPSGELAVQKHILGEFKKNETEILKKVFKKVVESVEVISTSDLQKAMTEFNK